MPKPENDKQQHEIEHNMIAFELKLPELVLAHHGKYAVLRHQAVRGIYDTLHDAHLSAEQQYTDGLYSIQKITQHPESLGIFSHAGPHAQT